MIHLIRKMKNLLILAFLFVTFNSTAQIQEMKLLNFPVDISPDFRDFTNTYCLADSLSKFNPATASGEILYKRYNYVTRQAFDNMLGVLSPAKSNEFPGTESVSYTTSDAADD